MSEARRHTLLVVDDEQDILDSVRDLFRLDYEVIGVTRAREAMRVLAEREVQVVMSDQRMPEMSGVEFLHRVREEHPDVIRLLVTGYADMRAVIDAINQGSVYRYITKPWDPDELQTVLREACERYDLFAERRRLIAELQASNAELRRVDARKTAFIKVIGHELRTPLTLQLGLARLALRTRDLTPELAREWFARIERSAARLHQRSEQILALLHEEHFARTLDRRPADVPALLHAVADSVRPFVERRGQTLRVDVPDDLGAFPLDGPKVEDSLQQLLFNAIKFTPDGGAITLSARRLGGALRLEVTDGGAGIPPEEIDHLFEPFFTGFAAERHSTGQFEHGARGMGLGLSVVRAFVEMHGGVVRAGNSATGAAVFTIDLPEGPAASP